MIFRILTPILLGLSLLPFATQAALVTYNNEVDLIANGGAQTRYDFETASGFPTGDYDPTLSLIGNFDGIQFNATTISPSAPTSGSQAMSGENGTYTAASLDFSGLSQRITGFGLYGLDLKNGLALTPDEFIRINVDFRLGDSQTFDIRLGSAPNLTPIYFAAYDAEDSIRSLSIFGIDDGGNNRGWYIDDLTLMSAAVPLPPALSLFLGGLVLLGRFCSKREMESPAA